MVYRADHRLRRRVVRARLTLRAPRAPRHSGAPHAEPPSGTVQVSGGAPARVSHKTRPVKIPEEGRHTALKHWPCRFLGLVRPTTILSWVSGWCAETSSARSAWGSGRERRPDADRVAVAPGQAPGGVLLGEFSDSVVDTAFGTLAAAGSPLRRCEPQRSLVWFPQRYVARGRGSVIDGQRAGPFRLRFRRC